MYFHLVSINLYLNTFSASINMFIKYVFIFNINIISKNEYYFFEVDIHLYQLLFRFTQSTNYY